MCGNVISQNFKFLEQEKRERLAQNVIKLMKNELKLVWKRLPFSNTMITRLNKDF